MLCVMPHVVFHVFASVSTLTLKTLPVYKSFPHYVSVVLNNHCECQRQIPILPVVVHPQNKNHKYDHIALLYLLNYRNSHS